MRIITNTNIIVDDFEIAKDYPKDTFIHFLSHFHQDHWQGMSPLWNYGKIFCSKITKQFILNKFPKIERITILEFFTIYYLNLLTQEIIDQKSDEFTIEVILFPAHHIPGSTMYLFRGYMGTILHTGDFRFSQSMITENSILFPGGKAINIDELIYDNTYCDPMFDFPTADIVAQQMIKIIEKNIRKRILIAMGALGKEAILFEICKYFKTKIIVSEEKFNQIQASSSENLDLFTTNKKNYFIEIVKRSHRQEIISKLLNAGVNDFICINTDFLMQEHRDPDGINYLVPYSLHSNYQEIKSFVQTLKPAILRKLVVPYENFVQYRRKARINFVKGFQNYIKKLQQNGESGHSILIRECTDFTKISKNYRQWMTEEKFNSLMNLFKIPYEPDRNNRKRKVDQVMPKPSIKQCLNILEEQCIYTKKPEKLDSLEDISNRLKATNNNHQITKYLTKTEENPNENQKEQEIYDIIQEYLHFYDS